MKLLTKEILKKLPPLAMSEGEPEGDKRLICKLFAPWGCWTWYLTEYDPLERMAFGFVYGLEREWGFFSLKEIEDLRGPGGLKVERDRFFTPIKFSDIKHLN